MAHTLTIVSQFGQCLKTYQKLCFIISYIICHNMSLIMLYITNTHTHTHTHTHNDNIPPELLVEISQAGKEIIKNIIIINRSRVDHTCFELIS